MLLYPCYPVVMQAKKKEDCMLNLLVELDLKSKSVQLIDKIVLQIGGIILKLDDQILTDLSRFKDSIEFSK